MSRLVEQLREALDALSVCRTVPALIGGMALAAHGVIRATQDVDLLVDGAEADAIEEILLELGYTRHFRSEDAANYVRGDERLDLLYALRPAATRLLADAADHHTPIGRVRVVSAEGLIGFKVQGIVNDPRRRRDLEDIRELLRRSRGRLNMDEIRSYFELFDRSELLDELLAEID
jgi:hypothetical protein